MNTLDRLAAATEAKEVAHAEWERLIAEAISEGHSERKIGRAAGITGVAIHFRKALLPTAEMRTGEPS